MKDDVSIKNGIIIPGDELEVTTSRSGGPGGQHVNKSDTRITVRWNVRNTNIFSDAQKERVLQRLGANLTRDGDLIVHSSASRSQQQNKREALKNLAVKVRRALHVPKKRMKTRVPKGAKEARLQAKTRRSVIKKMRGKKIQED
jgi:ribosome-associated protein